MMRSVAALFLTCAMELASVLPAASQSEPFFGQVSTFAFGFCPRGWAPTSGQLLPINQNQALFSLIGTTYGGNGQTNFALPNTSAIPTLTPGTKLTQCIALQGVFPSRQ